MKAFEYAVAKNTSGALEARHRGFYPKASGLDVLDMMKERIAPADKVVSLHELTDWRYVKYDKGALAIGPNATLRDIAESEAVTEGFLALAQACGYAATPQVRAKATAAGNLCQRPRCWYFRMHEYPCLKRGGGTCYAVDGENRYHAIFGGGPCHIVHPSNMATALVAGDGELQLSDRNGSRIVKAREFFVLPRNSMYSENSLRDGELITEIRVPRPPDKSFYVEFKEKQTFDWPLASCAVAFREGNWSVTLGAVAPIPWRAEAAEEVLKDQNSISEELAEAAAKAAVADANPMSQNAWRVKLAKTAVKRALLQADGKEIV